MKQTTIFIFLFLAFSSSVFALTTVDFSRDTINAGGRASYMTVWETDTALGYANITYPNPNTLLFQFPELGFDFQVINTEFDAPFAVNRRGIYASGMICHHKDAEGYYTCLNHDRLERCTWNYIWGMFNCVELPELNVTNISVSTACVGGDCITSWDNVTGSSFTYSNYFDQDLNTTSNVSHDQLNATTIRASSGFIGGAVTSVGMFPTVQESYDIGSTNKEWRNIYIGNGSTSSIIFGEDQEAQIYYSKGLQLISSVVKTSAAFETTGKTTLGDQMTAKEIIPAAASTYNLGSTSNEWNQIYVDDDGGIYFGLAQDVRLYRLSSLQLSLGGDGLRAGTLVPDAASTYSLGSTSAEYDQIYVDDNGGINFGIAQDNYLRRSNATEIQVQKDFAVLNESKVYETSTGSNAGSDICIGSRKELCICGSCS